MRVLLTRLSALGDIVHTWPLAEALHRGRPDIELFWLVERPFLSLVESHPAVTQAIPVATRRWRRAPWATATRNEVVATVRRLRALGCDLAIDSQGLLKSAVWARLARVPARVGLSAGHRRERLGGSFYTHTVTPPAEATHVVDINLALAGAVGVEPRLGALPDGRFLVDRAADPALTAGGVVLLPATGGPGKAWPASSFVALAAELARRGRPVTVAWGPGERALAEEIAAGAGAQVQVAPPTTIPELASLLSEAGLVVGGDTGTVHLAASLGVPTVGIFVATDPTRNGPRGKHVAVVAAAPSGSSHGRARTGAAGTVALSEVLAAAEQLLARKSPSLQP
ncbi:MAG TPA: lipopolysaccharide heptosyltransferase I [Thermoanaerobaculaceae bacterium]|nr:lipopolysaccharide heptosyltransferase I [Thermoanaerobaculaceae bacterium]HPS77255.1 lipopolysaccharide heptosyltransferase I [Thermoanaerobaculaceae bacterium]